MCTRRKLSAFCSGWRDAESREEPYSDTPLGLSWRPLFWSGGASGTLRAARIRSRIHLILGEWMVTVALPVVAHLEGTTK
jgi:hypothetical protein